MSQEKEHSCPFEVGDIVRLVTGASHQRVTAVHPPRIGFVDYRIQTIYVSSRMEGYDYKGQLRPVSKYILIKKREEKETEEMTKLYQTKNGAKFGTLLARNSAGRMVLEMKGSGEVETFAAEEVEEVRPYTVQVTSCGDDSIGGKSRVHFEAVKDSVSVGDLILTPQGRILRICEIDTKKESEGRLEGRRLMTEQLPVQS